MKLDALLIAIALFSSGLFWWRHAHKPPIASHDPTVGSGIEYVTDRLVRIHATKLEGGKMLVHAHGAKYVSYETEPIRGVHMILLANGFGISDKDIAKAERMAGIPQGDAGSGMLRVRLID